MKYRAGFVSNSSSSSFVISFPKKPETKEELAEMMGVCHPTSQYDSKVITSEDVVDFIWRRGVNDTSDEGRYPYDYSRERIADELFSDIDCNWIIESQLDLASFEQRQAIKAKFEEIVDILFPEQQEGGEFRMPITLSDDCSSFEASLVCGDIFRNVPHKCTGRR